MKRSHTCPVAEPATPLPPACRQRQLHAARSELQQPPYSPPLPSAAPPQITAHVQEKLHFCEQDRQARAAALESAEAALGEARAELTAAKAARERARRERSDLTQDWRLVSDPLCVEDMGAQQQRLAQLQAQAAELAARHAAVERITSGDR